MFFSYGVRSVWAFRFTLPSFILPWTGYCLGKSICPYSHWASTSTIPLLTLVIGLLVVIPALLAHKACYLFPWASSACLSYLYLVFLPWACWLSLPCWPIELVTSFLGLLQSVYLIFTSYSSYGPTGALLAPWVCYFFPWASSANLLYLYLLFLSWVCWLSFLPYWFVGLKNLLLTFIFLFPSTSIIVGLLFAIGHFVKSGHQHIDKMVDNIKHLQKLEKQEKSTF